MRSVLRLFYLIFFLIFFADCKKAETPKPSLNLWVKLNAPFIGEPDDIKFINADTGYVLGTYYSDTNIHNILIKTFDGGNTWQTITFSHKFLLDTSGGVMSNIYVSPFNSNILFSGNQNLIRSIDGGYHWYRIDTVDKKGTPNCYFFTPEKGICIGGGKVSKTTDSGFNWTWSYNAQSFINFDKLQFLNNQIGYFSGGIFFDGNNGGIMGKTTDGGNTWKLINYPFYDIISMYFINENTGYISMLTDSGDIGTTFHHGCELYKTTDGGKTWTAINTNIFLDLGNYAINLYFKNESEGFCSASGIYKTSNGGKTWQKESDAIVSYLCFPNPNIGYAIDTSGIILKRDF